MFAQNSSVTFAKLKVRYLILTFCLISIGAGIVSAAINIDEKSPMFMPVIYIGPMVTCCLLMLQKCRKSKINSKEIVGKLPRHIQWLRLVGLMLAVMGFSIGSAIIFFSLLSHVNPDFVRKILSGNQGLKFQSSDLFVRKFMVFLTVVIVAPITEEFLFRGIILNRWSEKWSTPTALVASSVFFGCLHAHPVGLSMFGLVMGLLYLQTKTLWIPIFCHAFNNFIVFAIMSFTQPKPTVSSALSSAKELQSTWWVGAVLSAISLIFLWRFIRQNFPSK